MQTKTRNALISNHYTHISIVHIKRSYTSYSLIRVPNISSTSPPNSNRKGTELFLYYSYSSLPISWITPIQLLYLH